MSKYAFVTLLYPNKYGICNYLDGALLTGLGLRRQKTKNKLICMITPDISNNIQQTLKIIYDEIIIVDYISPIKKISGIHIISDIFKEEDYKDDENYKEICKVFTKLHYFNSDILPYDKIVFIDNDIIPISKYDELFKLDTPAGWLEQIRELNNGNIDDINLYTRTWGIWKNIKHGEKIPQEFTDTYKIPGSEINGGLLVLKPNKKIFDYLIKQLQTPKNEWFGDDKKYKGTMDFDKKLIDKFILHEQSYITQEFSGTWKMIDGRYCAWGLHSDIEIYGLHMAGLRYEINKIWGNYKTWMIQIPFNDGFNIITNKLLCWAFEYYPQLKNIMFNDLKFYINNKLINIKDIKKDDDNYNKLNDYQQIIFQYKNIKI